MVNNSSIRFLIFKNDSNAELSGSVSHYLRKDDIYPALFPRGYPIEPESPIINSMEGSFYMSSVSNFSLVSHV